MSILNPVNAPFPRPAALFVTCGSRESMVNCHHVAIPTGSGRMAIYTVKVEDFHGKLSSCSHPYGQWPHGHAGIVHACSGKSKSFIK